MSPGNTRQSKSTAAGKKYHNLSESESLQEESPFSFSSKQMESVSLLVQSAVSAAMAHALPNRIRNTQTITICLLQCWIYVERKRSIPYLYSKMVGSTSFPDGRFEMSLGFG